MMLGLNGTLTSYQVSNAMIVLYAPDKTVTVSFTIDGSNGTEIFGNMTIPKTALYAGQAQLFTLTAYKPHNRTTLKTPTTSTYGSQQP